jgi:hypothetical protein
MSFGCATASLREAVAPLSMTGLQKSMPNCARLGQPVAVLSTQACTREDARAYTDRKL